MRAGNALTIEQGGIHVTFDAAQNPSPIPPRREVHIDDLFLTSPHNGYSLTIIVHETGLSQRIGRRIVTFGTPLIFDLSHPTGTFITSITSTPTMIYDTFIGFFVYSIIDTIDCDECDGCID